MIVQKQKKFMKGEELLQKDLEPLIAKFYQWEKETPDNVFLKQPYGNTWKTLTYKEAGEEARRILTALQKMGLAKGQHIAILSKNCYHWILADLAIMMGAYVSVPLYYNITKEQLREVLIQGDVEAIFIGKLDEWGDKTEALPEEIKVIRMPHYKGNAEVEEGVAWEKLIEENKANKESFVPAIDSLWKIKFTSGTTGKPKGVMLQYKTPSMIMRGQEISGNPSKVLSPQQKYFSFLPLNHIAEIMAVFVPCLFNGGTISFVESLETFSKNLKESQPGFIFVVPRILTKFHLGVLNKLSQKKLNILLKVPILSQIIKKKINKNLGLDNLKVGYTGSAITPKYLKEWFKKLDIHFWEVYGMTEIGGILTLGFYKDTPPDSVGKVMPFGELKIDEKTGEILARVPWIMQGYYKDKEKTAEVLKDGWYSKTLIKIYLFIL